MSGFTLYAAVFLAAFGESTVLIGLLIPGVGILIGAGALAARGGAEVMGVALCASIGSILGSGLSFYAGKVGGTRLERWSARAAGSLAKARALLDRYGGWGVFLGHFFGPIRAFIAFVAGAGDFSPRRFWIACISGGLGWGFGLTAAGAALSGGWRLFEVALGRGSLILAAFVILLYLSLRVSAGALALGLRVLPPTSSMLLAFLKSRRELPWLRRLAPAHPRFLAWIQKRLSPDHATGLLLSTGAVACAFFAWIFFGVMEGLLFHDPLIGFDLKIHHLLQALRTPRGDFFFLLVTYLGSGPVLAVSAAAATAALYTLQRRFEAGLLLLGFGSGELLTWALKHAVARPRPSPLITTALETSAAFPSNHAFSSVALFGFLAYAASRGFRSEAAKARLFAGAGVMIVAVGVSRLYLGAHWPSDVAAGYALGGIWLSALITATEVRSRLLESSAPRRRRAAFVWGAAVVLLVGATWGGLAWQRMPKDLAQTGAAPLPRTVGAELLGPELARLAGLPVEDMTGTPLGHISLFVATGGADLRSSLASGGWTATGDLRAAEVLRRWADAMSGKVAPEAAAYPLFWENRPQDVAFATPDQAGGRWVVRCWQTGVFLKDQGDVWGLWDRHELPPKRFLGIPTPTPPPPGEAEAPVVSTLRRSYRQFRPPAVPSTFVLLVDGRGAPESDHTPSRSPRP